MSDHDPGTGTGRSSEERPNALPEEAPEEVPALDEAPDGHTPGEPTDRDEGSLPPG